jgi:hypothetical protein
MRTDDVRAAVGEATGTAGGAKPVERERVASILFVRGVGKRAGRGAPY